MPILAARVPRRARGNPLRMLDEITVE